MKKIGVLLSWNQASPYKEKFIQVSQISQFWHEKSKISNRVPLMNDVQYMGGITRKAAIWCDGKVYLLSVKISVVVSSNWIINGIYRYEIIQGADTFPFILSSGDVSHYNNALKNVDENIISWMIIPPFEICPMAVRVGHAKQIINQGWDTS